jgi:hypothetical protein
MPTSVRFIAGAPGGAGGYEFVPPGGGVDEMVPAGGGVEETGAMPTSVRFIAAAPVGRFAAMAAGIFPDVDGPVAAFGPVATGGGVTP